MTEVQIGFCRALIAGALVLSLGLPVAWGQGGPPATSQGQGNDRGYGPGMMGRGYGYGLDMMGGGYGPGMMWGGGDRRVRDASTAESSAEGHLAFLKTELKIKSQQLPLWDKYAEATRANVKTMYEGHKALFERAQADQPLPQQLDQREQIMALNLDAMRKTDAALKPLYAALDDNQKQIADRYLGFGMMPLGGMF